MYKQCLENSLLGDLLYQGDYQTNSTFNYAVFFSDLMNGTCVPNVLKMSRLQYCDKNTTCRFF